MNSICSDLSLEVFKKYEIKMKEKDIYIGAKGKF